jgi:hypothetical protein
MVDSFLFNFFLLSLYIYSPYTGLVGQHVVQEKGLNTNLVKKYELYVTKLFTISLQ